MLSKIKDKTAAIKQKLQNDKSLRSLLMIFGVGVFAIFGVWFAGYSMANTGGSSGYSYDAKEKCGARVSNYNYEVPFGNAPWNVPVCNLPKHPRSDEYASRMYNYGVFNDGTPETANNKGKFSVSFGLEPAHKNWSRAVYYAKDATTTRQVRVCTNGCYPSNFDDGKGMYDAEAYLPERRFPWNPDWEVATAGDNELVIIDEEKGHLFSFSSVKTGLAATMQCGFIATERLCASSAKILRDHNGKIADYRTFEGSDGSRGGGISYYATLLTPQEVKAGEIRHALGMGIYNTSFGPECTKEQLEKNDPKVVDIKCGTAVAPAAKFEWASGRSIGDRIKHHKGSSVDKFMDISKTVPEGMRFALDIDDAFIENWIKSREDLRNNPRKAETARIIARALRDYGWIPLDTSGYGAGIQTAGGMSKKNRELWKELGITSEKDDDIVRGLFTEDNIYTIEPPTNFCTDGRQSKYYCKYSSSKYTRTTDGLPATTPDIGQNDNHDDHNHPNPDDNKDEDNSPGNNNNPGNTGGGPSQDPIPDPPANPNPDPTKPEPGKVDPVISPTAVTIPSSIPINIGWNFHKWEFHQAARLSWSASSSPNGIDRYVLSKNGRAIYEGTKRSYSDFDIENGKRYRYQVVAIDKKGNRSSAAEFDRSVECSWFGWICKFATK